MLLYSDNDALAGTGIRSGTEEKLKIILESNSFL